MVELRESRLLGAGAIGVGYQMQGSSPTKKLDLLNQEREDRVPAKKGDRDRVEISRESRQYLEDSFAAVSTETVANPKVVLNNKPQTAQENSSSRDRNGFINIPSRTSEFTLSSKNPIQEHHQGAQSSPTNNSKNIGLGNNAPRDIPTNFGELSPNSTNKSKSFLEKVIDTNRRERANTPISLIKLTTGSLNNPESSAQLNQSGPIDSDIDQGGGVSRHLFDRGNPDPRNSGKDALTIESILSTDNTTLGINDPLQILGKAIRTEEGIPFSQPELEERILKGPKELDTDLHALHKDSQNLEASRHDLDEEIANLKPQNILAPHNLAYGNLEYVAQSTVGGNLAQKPISANANGLVSSKSAPSQNFTQQAININADPQPDQGNSRRKFIGQNPVSQQARRNSNAEPVGSKPRAVLEGQNPIRETVQQNNSEREQNLETAGVKDSRTTTSNVQLQAKGPNSKSRLSTQNFNSQSQNSIQAKEKRATLNLNPSEDTSTSNRRVLSKKETNTVENGILETSPETILRVDPKDENNIELLKYSSKPAINIQEQSLGSLMVDKSQSPSITNQPGENSTKKVQPEESEIKRLQTERFDNQQEKREINNKQKRELDTVSVETQIGRNVDRLI